MDLESGAPQSSSSRLLVVMFTDLVDSSKLKAQLGPEAFRQMKSRHDAFLRQALAAAPSGRGLQDTGDGYFLSFESISHAINAALLFQWLMSQERWPHPFATRIGLHLGEVEQGHSEVTGQADFISSAIDIASRTMSLATGGQILLTRAVFDAARQVVRHHPAVGLEDVPPLLKWMAHGPYLFKGAAEPVDVFEVGVELIAPLSPPADSEKARRHIRPGDEETLGWRPAINRALENSPQWVLTGKIGEGGFGEVWLAEHVKSRAKRVFKFCFDSERLRALKREVVLFRLLKEALGDRRDIAAVKDWQFDHAPYFIELDYCPEGNLVQWAESQGGIEKVPVQRRLTFVAQIAEALSAAHSVGILHKDIKPSNVLIGRDGADAFYPRLTDFGIGILTDRDRLKEFNITDMGFTASNITMNDSSRTGTRMYTPPESMLDKPHTVQGDVYALGILLYQMAVGDLQRPLAVGWERDIADELLRLDIAACVDGNAQRRLASADALSRQLASLETRRSEKQRAQTLAARAARRQTLGRTALAGLVLLLLVVSVALFRERQIRRAERQINLSREFSAELDKPQKWTPERIDTAWNLVSAISEISKPAAEESRRRLFTSIEADTQGILGRPSLSESDAGEINAIANAIEPRQPQLAQSLRLALRERKQQWQSVFEIKAPFANASSVFAKEMVEKSVGNNAETLGLHGTPDAKGRLLMPTRFTPAGTVRLAMDCELSKEFFKKNAAEEQASGMVGLAFGNLTGTGYWFELHPDRLVIRRGAVMIGSRSIDSRTLGQTIHISIKRESDALTFQAGSEEPLVALDVFALPETPDDRYCVCSTVPMRIKTLVAQQRSQSLTPSPIEAGDRLYSSGKFADAAAEFARQVHSHDLAISAESRFKLAMCNLQANETSEATAGFESLFSEASAASFTGNGRWAALAGCRIWLMHLQRREFVEADRMFDTLRQMFTNEQLNTYVPLVERELISEPSSLTRDMGLITLDEADLAKRKRDAEVSKLLGTDAFHLRQESLFRAYAYAGRWDAIVNLFDTEFKDKQAGGFVQASSLEYYFMAMRQLHKPNAALQELDKRSAYANAAEQLLDVERARTLWALGRRSEAESTLDRFLERCAPDGLHGGQYRFEAEARIMKGFMCDDRGEHAAALAIWHKGVVHTHDQVARARQYPASATSPTDSANMVDELESGLGSLTCLTDATILGGLSGEWTEEEGKVVAEYLLDRAVQTNTAANHENLFQQVHRRVQVPPDLCYAIWTSPRGRGAARHMAFRDEPFRDSILAVMRLAMAEEFSRAAADGHPSPDEETLFDQLGEKLANGFANGKVSVVTTGFLLYAWGGNMGLTGWKGAALTLDPSLRGPMAYVIACKFSRLGDNDKAKLMFDFCRSDAASGSLLARVLESRANKAPTREATPPATDP